MMRFTDYAVPSVANLDKIWDNIDFKYSSNRLPEYYSSDGLYVEEVMNNALAYFENGQREMGMKQFRACLVPLMKGSSAGQGTVQHIVKADLSNNGHIDFADCTSQYARTAAEGIFGIKVNVPDSKADIKPGFPADWKYASIKMDAVSYDYKYENNTDKFSVTSKSNLSYEMHVPTRSSKITSVKVNGTEVTDYTVDNFVNVKYHQEFLKDVHEEIRRNSKAPFVKNFRMNYAGGMLPIYALVEVFSFGTLSKFYKNMKNPDKKAIAKSFGIGYTYLESGLESISYVRNICAHYGRLYNAKLSKTPMLYKEYSEAGIGNNRIFGVLLCLKHILKNDNHWNMFVDKIEILFDKYENVDITTMGFKENWKALLENDK